MRISILSPTEIGRAVREQRKRQGLRQEDLAAIVGASHVFLRDVEQGKSTVQLGRVLRVLEELGIGLVLDLPEPDSSDTLPAATGPDDRKPV